MFRCWARTQELTDATTEELVGSKDLFRELCHEDFARLADVFQGTQPLTRSNARAQERAQALSSVREAQAAMENAQSEMERRKKLHDAEVISREEMERYTSEYEVGRAKYQAAVERHSLVDDRAREEDQAFAEADLKLAKAQLEEARARYEKTFIKSPIDGTVLRKHHRNGESVSNSSTVPDPILTVGDKKVLRVRMEVDETEVSQVRLGQNAYVTADAYGQKKF